MLSSSPEGIKSSPGRSWSCPQFCRCAAWRRDQVIFPGESLPTGSVLPSCPWAEWSCSRPARAPAVEFPPSSWSHAAGCRLDCPRCCCWTLTCRWMFLRGRPAGHRPRWTGWLPAARWSAALRWRSIAWTSAAGVESSDPGQLGQLPMWRPLLHRYISIHTQLTNNMLHKILKGWNASQVVTK